jgi:hypothetical protein
METLTFTVTFLGLFNDAELSFGYVMSNSSTVQRTSVTTVALPPSLKLKPRGDGKVKLFPSSLGSDVHNHSANSWVHAIKSGNN